jgi:hypothetical protein
LQSKGHHWGASAPTSILLSELACHEWPTILTQRALTLLERILGPEHPNLAAALDNYADLLWKMQREAEAENAEARAKAIWAKHKREPAGK